MLPQKGIVLNRLNTPIQPNILDLIDFCKGFFILWIVYFHFNKGDGVGWQGVHPFIVFSGFGLTYSCLVKRDQEINWKQWFLKRAQRILPAYWVVCFLGLLLAIGVTAYSQESCNLRDCGLRQTMQFFLEVSFLKVLSYRTMWSLFHLDHMWFVPLIVSLYAIFPLLFKFLVAQGDITKNCIRLLCIAVLAEFFYRFLAIYLLDGFPIGYENALFGIPTPPALDSLPAWFPFQSYMPFGLFPSRIGEFVLGMFLAVAFVYHHKKLNQIFSGWMVGAGVLVWVIGCAFVYINRIGWVASDFLIALGLVLVCVNLAWISQKHSSFVFSRLSILGVWSYCVYLTHNLLKYAWFPVEERVISFLSSLPNSAPYSLILVFKTKVTMLVIFGLATLLASWLLMKFDRSKLPKWLIENTIARVLSVS
ncbi:MAG: acyltransferase [Oscillatoriales cyanobacterium C42_A2020_001]|nr:acyltransferase [Leptolyngbyaceae cyanobacterium C42_A2020_001]